MESWGVSKRGAALVLVAAVLLCGGMGRAQSGREDKGAGSEGVKPFSGLARPAEPNLFAGTATTAIAIEVPPGRKNLTPQLSLTYNSNGGPSPYGYGWNLPLATVQRSTRDGVQSCFSTGLDFVLTLPGGAIECRRESGGRCVPRIESAFVRIVYMGGLWQAWDKSGLKYVFGEPATASADGGLNFNQAAQAGTLIGHSTDMVWDYGFEWGNGSCRYTSIWALTSVEDPNGNRMEIRYLYDQGVLYPHSILYGGHRDPSTRTLTLEHPFRVEFHWQSRPDWVASALLAQTLSQDGKPAPTTLTRRLERIEVKYNTRTVRAYSFTYDDSRLGRQSLLKSVMLVDANNRALSRYDGSPVASVFHYSEHTAANGRLGFESDVSPWPWVGGTFIYRTQFFPVSGAPLPSYLRPNSSRPNQDVFDLDGDAFPDLVATPGAWGKCSPGPGYWKLWRGSSAGFAATAIDWYVPDRSVACHVRWRKKDCGGDTSCMLRDTLDIDGDGWADFVDANSVQGYWQIYYGDPNAGGAGVPGFLPAVQVAAPGDLQVLQRSDPTPNYVTEIQALRDMTGDGLPDVVVSRYNGSFLGTWKVWRNLGRGKGFLSSPENFTAPYGHLSQRSGTGGHQKSGTYDVNGDGLPDFVEATDQGHWKVHYHAGRGFAPPVQWPMNGFGANGWYIADTDDKGKTTDRDFFDINGDGLPDVVDVDTQGQWWVLFNRGGGFAPAPVRFEATGPIRESDEDGVFIDVLDMDGDGLIDQLRGGFGFTLGPGYGVAHNLGGAWKTVEVALSTDLIWTTAPATRVVENPHGARVDLLVEMENGVGGSTRLDYRPSTQWDNTGGDGVVDLPMSFWTVTEITHEDGMCDERGEGCLNPGSAHQRATQIRYQGGRFDAERREFRGFFLVWSQDAAALGDNFAGRASYFHQQSALSGRPWITDDYELDGVSGEMRIVKSTVNSWECVDPTNGQWRGCSEIPPGGVWVRLYGVYETEYSLTDLWNFRTVSTINHAWHLCNGKYYGNVSHSSRGDISPGAPRVHTHTEYACSASGYVVDRPLRVSTSNGSNRVLEEKWFFYDGLPYGSVSYGNLVRVESWLNEGRAPTCSRDAARRCVATEMRYDVYGNVIEVRDGRGQSRLVRYDSTQIYPAVSLGPELSDAQGRYRLASAEEYDAGCGTLLSRTVTYKDRGGLLDPALPRERREYDSFCRLTAIFRPGPEDSAFTGPYQNFVYVLGGRQRPSSVYTFTKEPNASGVDPVYGRRAVVSLKMSDALGRVIQEKSETFVDGAVVMATTAIEYDSLGRPVRRYAPWATALSALPSYTAVPAGQGRTELAYDGVGRLIASVAADGARSEWDYSVPRQTTTRDACYAQPQPGCPGGMVIEKRDALGRTVEKLSYEQASLKAASRFSYDELGRLTASEQWDGQSWRSATRIEMTYDSLGRKLSMRDPDSGLWRYRYDEVGNLLHQDDPKAHQSVQFCYDAMGRVLRKWYLATDSYQEISGCELGGAVEQVAWSYDSAPGGAGKVAAVEDASGLTVYVSYDDLGNVLRIERTIDGVVGATSYGYDSAGRVQWMTYPDGEQVRYGYDAAGRLRELRSNHLNAPVYLRNVTYDLFGRAKTIVHGNGAVDHRLYGSKEQNYRLQKLETTLSGGSALNYAYSYTRNGQVASLSDNASGFLGRPNSSIDGSVSELRYDGLGRLIYANGPRLGSRNYQYDALGNMIVKDNVVLEYETERPHCLKSVNGRSTGIAHDANGNRLGKATQSYAYDTEDRLKRIEVGSNTIEFVYDHAGQRVKKSVQGSTTRYYGAHFEVEGGRVRKYYYAGDLLIASRESQAPAVLIAALPRQAIELAGVSLGAPALVLRLRDDVQVGAAAAATVVLGGLLLAPWRTRTRLRKGHVVLVVVAFTAGTLPWPVVVQAGGGGSATPTPVPTAQIHHYHLNHLGSVELITDGGGAPYQYIRYTPYGEVRGRWSASGQWLNAPMAQDTREFTGYDSEILSGLQYAGARWYDPTLGLFLTHDPARQFANPYTYTNGDPVNLTDPTGAFVGELIAGILAIAKFIADYAVPIGVTLGFGTAFGQTLANGGTFGQAFAAGVIGGVMGGVGAYGMGIVGGYVASKSPALSYALAAVALASGTYQTVESFRSGQYVAGAVGAVFVAFGVASLLASTSRAAQGGNGQTGGLSQQEQLDFAAAEYGQRFSYAEVPAQYADARGVTLNDATTNPYAPYDQPLGDPGAGQIDLQVRMRATGYCNGAACGAVGKPGDPGYGIMKSGFPTARGAIAADPTLFRFGTRIDVPGYGPGTVLDTGGAIKGLRLDLWFATRQEAIAWGVRDVVVTVRIPVRPLP